MKLAVMRVFFIRLLGTALGYVVVVLIAKNFGVEELGFYSLLISMLVVITAFTTLGYPTSILRVIPKLINDSELPLVKRMFFIMQRRTLLLSVAVSIFIWIASAVYQYAGGDKEYLHGILPILCITIVFLALSLNNIEFIRALNRIAYSELFRNVFRQVLLVLLLVFVFNQVGLSVFFSILLLFIATSLVVASQIGKVKALGGDIGFSVKTSHSKKYMLSNGIGVLGNNADILIIGALLTQTDLGSYSVIAKLSLVLNFILYAVNAVLATKISSLYWSGEIATLKAVIHRAAKASFVALIVLFLIILGSYDYLLTFIDENAAWNADVLYIMLVGQFIFVLAGPVGIYLNLTGEESLILKVTVISAVFQILLLCLLIPFYGVLGAASGVALVALGTTAFLLRYMYKRDGFTTLPFGNG